MSARLKDFVKSVFFSFTLLSLSCLSVFAQNPDFPSYGEDEFAGTYESNEDNGAWDFYSEEYSGLEDSEYSYTDEMEPEVAPEPEEPVIPRLEPGKPINLKEKSIRIGRIPFKSIKEMMAQSVPFLHFMKQKTGAADVRVVSSSNDYSSILDALVAKKIDFAWVGPAAYLKRRDQDHLMPVAKARFGADTAYRGVFIARANGKVQGLEDIKGSTIGFVDPQSTSGYLYPMYLLLRLGINPYQQSQVVFVHNHYNVLRALLAGKIDVGVCLEETINSFPDKSIDKKIIVLGKTNEVPSDVIVCRQDCPINLREKFLEALLQIKADELAGNSPTFLEASDEDYASVLSIINYIDSQKKK